MFLLQPGFHLFANSQVVLTSETVNLNCNNVRVQLPKTLEVCEVSLTNVLDKGHRCGLHSPWLNF